MQNVNTKPNKQQEPMIVYNDAIFAKLKLPANIADAVANLPLTLENIELIKNFQTEFERALVDLKGKEFFAFIIAAYQFVDLIYGKLPNYVNEALVEKVLDLNGE